MASNLALGAVAFAIFQLARWLPFPFRELLVVCVSLGVLIGASLTQPPTKDAGPTPTLPKCWTRAANSGAGDKAGAGGSNVGKSASAGGGDKRRSEILLYQGSDEQKRSGNATHGLAVAIVPGNPGLPHLYCRFAQILFQALADKDLMPDAVYVVGYPCFNTQVPSSGLETVNDGLGMLDAECSVVSHALEELERQHPGRLVVFGHSLGAWIALRHIGEGQETRTTRRRAKDIPPVVIAAMPYLEYSGGKEQEFLRKLVCFPYLREVVNVATHSVGVVPEAWVAKFACAVSDVDEQDEWMTHVFTSAFGGQPHHIVNMVLLLRSHLSRLATGFRDLEPALETSARPKVVALYARDDHWGPEDHRLRLDSLLADGDRVVDLGEKWSGSSVRHDFQMDHCATERMAHLVTSEILSTLEKK